MTIKNYKRYQCVQYLAFSILLCLFMTAIAEAQTFVLASGDITSTLSDSRSVNFFDLNNDGWEDIYVSNGPSGGQPDLLYLNNGDGTFSEVSNMDIVDASNPADGASFADYNNDGHIDGVVSSWHGAEDLLYLNDGSGSLDYNSDAGIVAGSYAETAAFGDYDNDGWLDLYITNSNGSNKNYLYRNLQDGTFQRISNHILTNDTKLSRGAIWGDFNNDGITDLFVANESNAANDIFFGQGNGDFSKLTTGTIVTSLKGSMTGSWGDIDNDGDFDLFVGNSAYFLPQQNQLFRNTGNGFEEITGTPVTLSSKCTYGSAFGDFDNDGDLDLLVANGYCNIGLANILYENQGDGSFVDQSALLPSNLNICSFGAAWGDVDNDGFLDLMIANCRNNGVDNQKVNTLLMNQGNANNWLKIRLTGVQSNANAIGAKVKVKATINGQEVWQTREIRSQSGYAGQNSMIAHFGLGNGTTVDSIIIHWPAGGEQILENESINQKLEITEDLTISVEEVGILANVNLSAFPNPVSANAEHIDLSITNNDGNENASLRLYDILGKIHWEKNIDLLKGENHFTIPIARQNLAQGIYQVSLWIDGDTLTKKIQVIR